MQRKKYIINRNGFALIMAIFLLLIISGLMLKMLSTTAEGTQRTTNEYLNEQALLLTRSATEYAVLAVSGHQRQSDDGTVDYGCIHEINAVYPDAVSPWFNITVNIQYIGFGSIAGCNNLINEIQTEDSNGSMLMDVYVQSNNANLGINETIRYHRRTIQKL